MSKVGDDMLPLPKTTGDCRQDMPSSGGFAGGNSSSNDESSIDLNIIVLNSTRYFKKTNPKAKSTSGAGLNGLS